MFRRWFIWCMVLAVLGGNVVIAYADQKSEKDTTKSKSELIAAEYGYTVVEDVDPSQCAVKDLEFVPFLKEGESYINSKEMRKRAVTLKANLGLVDAKRLLDNQSEIPTEFRGGGVLVFTGTLLRYSDGSLFVAYLGWCGGCWRLNFNWVDIVFFGRLPSRPLQVALGSSVPRRFHTGALGRSATLTLNTRLDAKRQDGIFYLDFGFLTFC